MTYECIHCKCEFEKYRIEHDTICPICGKKQQPRVKPSEKAALNKLAISIKNSLGNMYPKNNPATSPYDDEWDEPTQEIGFCDEHGVLWESEEKYADLIKWRDKVRGNLGKRTKRKG